MQPLTQYLSIDPSWFAGKGLREWLVLIGGGLGLAWYFVCLFWLGLKNTPPGGATTTFHGFMALSLTTIATTLATFVGMLLGLSTVSDSVRGAATAAAQAGETQSAQNAQAVVAAVISPGLQWWAAGLYVSSMVIALVMWARNQDNIDPAVSNLGKSLLGFFVGIFTIAFNLPKSGP